MFDYNCTWMEYRILETREYDSSGRIIRSVLSKDQNKKFKIQEPVNKQFHDLVCQRINFKKEVKKQIQGHEEKKSIKKPFKKLPDKKILSEKAISSKTPVTLKTYFTVQIGAFENISYARTLKNTLNKKGYHTYIIHTKKKGNLYKVCIEKFSDRKKAKALAEKIKKTEGFHAFVTIW
ncbi:MAG: SPOR domain-containing protein [Nitrospirae bacterium]|nr:SPOR domain-containing protein [Nitrospirota bacterium]